MDNVQDQGTTNAPGQGQAVVQSQTPSSDARSGIVDATAARTAGQSTTGQEGFLLGKFKSPEDLAKAYQELESHNKKVEMDRAELEKLFIPSESVTPTTQPQAAAAVQDNPDESMRQAVQALMPEVRRELSPVFAKFEVNDMVQKYGGDFIALAQETKQVQNSNPNLSLEDAYKMAAFDHLQKTSQAQAQQQQVVAQQNAQRAQVETAQPSGYRAPSIEDAVRDPKVSVSEISEALGPEYGTFAEVSKRRAGSIYKKS